jgi:hypothetical protein
MIQLTASLTRRLRGLFVESYQVQCLFPIFHRHRLIYGRRSNLQICFQRELLCCPEGCVASQRLRGCLLKYTECNAIFPSTVYRLNLGEGPTCRFVSSGSLLCYPEGCAASQRLRTCSLKYTKDNSTFPFPFYRLTGLK